MHKGRIVRAPANRSSASANARGQLRSLGLGVRHHYALMLVMAAWVMADARKRGRRLCHDYDSFVFFAWPIVVPIYLFQTRGARAFLTLLCFIGICIFAMLAAAVVFIIREFV